jgi:hypothetical protein
VLEIEDHTNPPMLMNWDHHYITPIKDHYQMILEHGEEPMSSKEKSANTDKSKLKNLESLYKNMMPVVLISGRSSKPKLLDFSKYQSKEHRSTSKRGLRCQKLTCCDQDHEENAAKTGNSNRRTKKIKEKKKVFSKSDQNILIPNYEIGDKDTIRSGLVV